LFEHETDVAMRATILRAMPDATDKNVQTLIGPILKNPQTPVVLLSAAIEIVQKAVGNKWNDDLIRLAENPVNDQILVQLFQVFGQNKLSQTVPLLGKNLAVSNSTVRQAAAAALTQIGGDAAIAQFMPGLASPSVDIRRQSIEALGTLRAKSAVPQLIKLSADSQLSINAIQALIQMPDLSALAIYLDGLASKNAVLRSQCRTAVTTLRDAALPLIEAKLTSTNGLPDDTIASLRQIYQLNAAAKKGPLFKVKVKQIQVAEYQSFALANPGDSHRGQKIFSNVNGAYCVRCHRINGQGGLIGPELTGIGAKQSRAQIIESVLYPSKLILDGYQQVFFYMTNDEDFSGIIRAETTDTVTVIDSLGVTNVLQKSKIKNRKISQISLMPEGLQTGLSLEEFSDLIAYVENPNPASPTPQPVEAAAPPPSNPEDFLNLPPFPFETSTAVATPIPLARPGAHATPIMHPRPIVPQTPPAPVTHATRVTPPRPKTSADDAPLLPIAPPAPPGFPQPPTSSQ
jgi:putative heme-binding domain-containing protein